jgi:hypothetical protein
MEFMFTSMTILIVETVEYVFNKDSGSCKEALCVSVGYHIYIHVTYSN